MSFSPEQPASYQPPRIEDYGTLEELTADSSLLSPLGLGSTIAAVTSPLVPGGPGGGGHGGAGDTPGNTNFQGVEHAGGTPGDTGDVSPADSTSPGTVGAGGPGGGSGGGGGGGGELPFTGFPAVLAAAVGGGLASAGAALRRAFRPRS